MILEGTGISLSAHQHGLVYPCFRTLLTVSFQTRKPTSLWDAFTTRFYAGINIYETWYVRMSWQLTPTQRSNSKSLSSRIPILQPLKFLRPNLNISERLYQSSQKLVCVSCHMNPSEWHKPYFLTMISTNITES
jgi:hypothetical protein